MSSITVTPAASSAGVTKADAPERSRTTIATGLGRGERLGLRWSDIDWKAGTLRVERASSPEAGRSGSRRARPACGPSACRHSPPTRFGCGAASGRRSLPGQSVAGRTPTTWCSHQPRHAPGHVADVARLPRSVRPGGRPADPVSRPPARSHCGQEAEGGVSEAVCKPSSVPSRLTAGRGWPSIWGRRSPDGSCGRPEGWAAHLSLVDGRPPTSCALLFGLAPGGVCPFHSGRRLAPPSGIVTVALVLASRRAGVTRHPALRSSDFPHAARRVAPSSTRSHPTASLTVRCYTRSGRDRSGLRTRPPRRRSNQPSRRGPTGPARRSRRWSRRTSRR